MHPMGDRPAAGQRPLEPLTVVRIHVPQHYCRSHTVSNIRTRFLPFESSGRIRVLPLYWERNYASSAFGQAFLQIQAVRYVREKGSISNAEHRALIGNLPDRTASRDLEELVEAGVLILTKKGRYTRYVTAERQPVNPANNPPSIRQTALEPAIEGKNQETLS